MKVRLLKKSFQLTLKANDPANFERHVTVLSPQEGFGSWGEALESITDFDKDAFQCWSVTMGSVDVILVLFDRISSHPHAATT